MAPKHKSKAASGECVFCHEAGSLTFVDDFIKCGACGGAFSAAYQRNEAGDDTEPDEEGPNDTD